MKTARNEKIAQNPQPRKAHSGWGIVIERVRSLCRTVYPVEQGRPHGNWYVVCDIRNDGGPATEGYIVGDAATLRTLSAALMDCIKANRPRRAKKTGAKR